VRGVQRGTDGANGHAEGISDRVVIEIGVVAKEEDEPLPFRKCCNQGSDRLAEAVLR